MCNHYHNVPEALSLWRDYTGWDGPVAGHAADMWPRRHALVIRRDDGTLRLDSMAWGVALTVPGKRPGSTLTKYVTNVRNLDSPFWRSTLATPAQRCLVPFSRFAEPIIGQGRAEAWFAVTGTQASSFAGLWRMTPQGPAVAFLTCAPNPLVGSIHPKAMPVILDPSDYQPWLEGEAAHRFATPFPSQLMTRLSAGDVTTPIERSA